MSSGGLIDVPNSMILCRKGLGKVYQTLYRLTLERKTIKTTGREFAETCGLRERTTRKSLQQFAERGWSARVGRGIPPRPDFNRPQTTLGGRLKSPEKTTRWVASLPHVVSGRVKGRGKGLAGPARGPRAGLALPGSRAPGRPRASCPSDGRASLPAPMPCHLALPGCYHKIVWITT
jgi:hypothetical protein